MVGFSGDCISNGHAWLWENGQIIDLNIFNHPSSGLDKLLLAYNINDGGEIDGLGVPPGVNPADVFTLGHVFVLIPCDDNHPGIESCDYSLVNGNARSIPIAVHAVSGQVRALPLWRRAKRSHFPGPRAFIPISGSRSLTPELLITKGPAMEVGLGFQRHADDCARVIVKSRSG